VYYAPNVISSVESVEYFGSCSLVFELYKGI